MKKKALITGITGQDGALLTELLTSMGYIVHGIKRRTSLLNTERIDHLYQYPHEKDRNLILHYGDMSDSTNLIRIIREVMPDEIYNLAAMSHVAVSFELPEYVANVDALGTLRILEAIRLLGIENRVRFYQASSSELYGLVKESPQKETTPFLYVGNLNSKRDWGHAKDYVKAMWLIMQQDEPDDYVISTGVSTSIKDFIKLSAVQIGLEVEFMGEGVKEYGMIKGIQEDRFRNRIGHAFLKNVQELIRKETAIIKVDTKYFRPTEVDHLVGDSSKAKQKLGWEPEYDLDSLIREMMESDIKLMKKENFLKQGGFEIKNYFE